MLRYENLLSILLARVAGYGHDLVALLGFCHDMPPLDLSRRHSLGPAAAIYDRRVLTTTGEVADATLIPCALSHNKGSNSNPERDAARLLRNRALRA